MKKSFRIFVLVMAMMLAMSAIANAAGTACKVFVNGKEIAGTGAYILEDGQAYIDDAQVLYKMFPAETEDSWFSEEKEETPLAGWAERFSYQLELKDGAAYFTKASSSNTTVPEVEVPSDNKTEQKPAETKKDCKVYVNGTEVSGTGAYLEDGKVYVDNPAAIFKIFPEDTKNIALPTVLEKTVLAEWANQFGYTMNVKDTTVYFTKDGQWETPVYTTPVIPTKVPESGIVVYLDGKQIAFPDQQPVIKNDRTLVPVRFVAESLGCKVEWRAADKVVVITKGSDTMGVYVGTSAYWQNGEWKQTDAAAEIINDRTMVPLRLIMEAFGCQVDYEEIYHTSKVKVIDITTTQSSGSGK